MSLQVTRTSLIERTLCWLKANVFTPSIGFQKKMMMETVCGVCDCGTTTMTKMLVLPFRPFLVVCRLWRSEGERNKARQRMRGSFSGSLLLAGAFDAGRATAAELLLFCTPYSLLFCPLAIVPPVKHIIKSIIIESTFNDVSRQCYGGKSRSSSGRPQKAS
jgi:hypothetical protein